MTPDVFRRLALGMPEASEVGHMGHPDFRVRGKIFATLGYPDAAWGMVKLTPEQQDALVGGEPAVFAPVKGGWGLRGATSIWLRAARARSVRLALGMAWENVAPRGSGNAARTERGPVDEYIATRPASVQVILRRVRGAIKRALPAAEEVISYRIPAYKLRGEIVLYFAGWKRHYSLYPASAHLVAAFEDELAPYELSKGTIRFPLSEPVPVVLIGRIARFRVKEAAERGSAKRARANATRAGTATRARTKRRRRR